MDLDKKIDITWKIFLNNQEMIKLSESKLKFTSVISGVLVTYMLAHLDKIIQNGSTAMILVTLFFVFFLIFVLFALLSSLPRFASKTGSNVRKLIYYKHIREKVEASEYIDTFNNSTDDDHLRDILYQAYEVSGIADSKFKYYRYSWFSLGFQLIAFFSILLLRVI